MQKLRYYEEYEEMRYLRDKARKNFVEKQAESEEYQKISNFRKRYKNIWYIYFLAITGLLIAATVISRIEKSWFTYSFGAFIVIVIVSIVVLAVILFTLKYHFEEKWHIEYEKSKETKEKTVEYNDKLAVLAIISLEESENHTYLSQIKDKKERLDAHLELVKIYLEAAYEKNNEKLTSDDIINYYNSLFLEGEKKSQ